MIHCDLHLHTSFSEDSEAPMRSMIEEALRRNLTVIGFTEHLDADYPPLDGSFSLDLNSYRETFLQLQEEYAGRIELLFGIELGMQPHLAGRYQALTVSMPFDYVLCSQHLVYGRDPWYLTFWDTHRDEEEVLEEYFRLLHLSLQLLHDYDICAHLDYLVRYLPAQDMYYSYARYAPLIDPILETLVREGKCLEINTSALAAGLKEPNPCRDIITRYHEMGGRRISVGSDAHTSERIAFGFGQVEELLRKTGFDSLTVYRRRKPFEIPF